MESIIIPGFTNNELHRTSRKALNDFTTYIGSYKIGAKKYYDKINELSLKQVELGIEDVLKKYLIAEEADEVVKYVLNQIGLNFEGSRLLVKHNRDIFAAIVTNENAWDLSLLQKLLEFSRKDLELFKYNYTSGIEYTKDMVITYLEGKLAIKQPKGGLNIPENTGYYLGQISYYKLDILFSSGKKYTYKDLYPLPYNANDTDQDIDNFFDYMGIVVPPDTDKVEYYNMVIADIAAYNPIFASKHYSKRLMDRIPGRLFFQIPKGEIIKDRSFIPQQRGEDFENTYIVSFTDQELVDNFSIATWKNRSDLVNVASTVSKGLSLPWRLNSSLCSNLGEQSTLTWETRGIENSFVIGYDRAGNNTGYKCIDLEELESIIFNGTPVTEFFNMNELIGEAGNSIKLLDFNKLNEDLIAGKLDAKFLKSHVTDAYKIKPYKEIQADLKKLDTDDSKARKNFDIKERERKKQAVKDEKKRLKDRAEGLLGIENSVLKYIPHNYVSLKNLSSIWRTLWEKEADYPDEYYTNDVDNDKLNNFINTLEEVAPYINLPKVETYFSDLGPIRLPSEFDVTIGTATTSVSITELDIKGLRSLYQALLNKKDNYNFSDKDLGFIRRLIAVIPNRFDIPDLRKYIAVYNEFKEKSKSSDEEVATKFKDALGFFNVWLAWDFFYAMFYRWWEAQTNELPLEKPPDTCLADDLIIRREQFLHRLLNAREALIPLNNEDFRNNQPELVKFIEGYRGIKYDREPKLMEEKVVDMINNNAESRGYQCGAWLSDYLVWTSYFSVLTMVNSDPKYFNKLINDAWPRIAEEIYNSVLEFTGLTAPVNGKLTPEQEEARAKFVTLPRIAEIKTRIEDLTNSLSTQSAGSRKTTTDEINRNKKELSSLQKSKIQDKVIVDILNYYENGVWNNKAFNFDIDKFQVNKHVINEPVR